jgi:queuine tRNA-ribosyltransferase
MTNSFTTRLLYQHKHTRARVIEVTTPHGKFVGPVFMPVGTRAGVNNLSSTDLQLSQTQIILGGNTYHMLSAPQMQVIENAGGMHNFMAWQGPMLTDSGGFQIFSLSKQGKMCNIDEDGANFYLPGPNQWMHMTPEVSLATQKIIGADIIMAFDECTLDSLDYDAAALVMARTHRWLERSCAYHSLHPSSVYGARQALFGIIQGGVHQKLRRQSAEYVASMATDGIAIGGETIGFDMLATIKIIDWIHDILPQDKARYTMGVGASVQDLLDVVAAGIDMFDCVAPTRNARHGALYCGELKPAGNWLSFESAHPNGRMLIKKACYADDPGPIMESCTCPTCQNYSRSHLHYLFKTKHELFSALASMHNVYVLHDACARMRDLIVKHHA